MAKERQDHPDGPLVSIDDAKRREMRERRLELGYSQEALAARVGATKGTISNCETGRHEQMRAKVYAKLNRVLFGSGVDADDDDGAYQSIVEDAISLTPAQRRAVAELVRNLKKSQ